MSATVCITPVKALADGKSRLSAWFDEETRAAFVQAMLEDVQAVIGAALPRSRRVVVTSDSQVARLALALGAEAIMQEVDAGVSAAIEFACDSAVAPGETCIVVPVDVPLADAADLQRLAGAVRQVEAVIVPDRHFMGTNAIAFRTPRRLPLCFGEGSLARHLAACAREGLHAQLLPLASIMHDIDVPADLFTDRACAAACRNDLRAAALLRAAISSQYCLPTW